MDIGKIEKNNFLLQNDQFFTKGVKIFRKHVFQLSWKAWIKVEKVLSLQRNDKKVTLLLIYHISGFIAHGFPPWLFHINLSIYLINIWLQPWVFVRTVVIFIDYTLQHLISNKKITNHSIGFLQVCWSLKKAKALEQEKTILWHFVYIWLFHLFLCCIIFYSHLRSFLKG